MNITITFRHMDTSEAIKRYAQGKVAKLQKFLRQPMTAKVTLSLEKLRHVAEAKIASGGARMEAKETSEDMYASIDRMIDKLERQIRGTKEIIETRKRRSGDTLRGGKNPKPVSAPIASEPAAKPAQKRAKATRKVATKKKTKKVSA
jgi:putative sigma-54 modulation protein